MKFTKRVFATTLFIIGSVVHLSNAFEGDEEPCPAFANQTSEFPPCIDCVSAGCGYVTDEGDCVKDCSAVPDSACFSSATNPDLEPSGICVAAESNSTLGAGSGANSTAEEAMCPESSGDTSTCELCVNAGCGWTADDGDCLLSCDEVNDGAACVSDISACTSDVATEEAMCPESSGDTSTCELCVSAGCGWTADDGDCLLSCDEVNDGAACVSVLSDCGEAADKGSETSSAGKPKILKLFLVFVAASHSAISTY